MDTEQRTEKETLAALPEAPEPVVLTEVHMPFRNTVVGAAVDVSLATEKYMGCIWLICSARLVHEDGATHEMHWKSRTLPMAMQFVQAMCLNYPGIKSMSVKVEL